jgi:hypothetical protein
MGVVAPFEWLGCPQALLLWALLLPWVSWIGFWWGAKSTYLPIRHQWGCSSFIGRDVGAEITAPPLQCVVRQGEGLTDSGDPQKYGWRKNYCYCECTCPEAGSQIPTLAIQACGQGHSCCLPHSFSCNAMHGLSESESLLELDNIPLSWDADRREQKQKAAGAGQSFLWPY